MKYNTLWLWTKFWWIIRSLYFLPVWIYLVRRISFQSKYNRKVWKLLKPYWFCPKVDIASFGCFCNLNNKHTYGYVNFKSPLYCAITKLEISMFFKENILTKEKEKKERKLFQDFIFFHFYVSFECYSHF